MRARRPLCRGKTTASPDSCARAEGTRKTKTEPWRREPASAAKCCFEVALEPYCELDVPLALKNGTYDYSLRSAKQKTFSLPATWLQISRNARLVGAISRNKEETAGSSAPGCRLNGTSLEVNTQAQLNIPRVADLWTGYAPGAQYAKAIRVRQIHRRIVELIVVEHIGEHRLERSAQALRDLEVLLHTEVHVPVGESTEHTVTTIGGVNAQDRGTNVVPELQRVLERVVLNRCAWVGIVSNTVTSRIGLTRNVGEPANTR